MISKNTHYQDKGIEVDCTDYMEDLETKVPRSRAEDYTAARWSGVNAFLPVAGKEISERDFPDDAPAALRDTVLSSFTNVEKHQIARRALFLEATAGEVYWEEAADELYPLINPDRSRSYARNADCTSTAQSLLTDVSRLIYRRTQQDSGLRGDSEALDVFGSALAAPEMVVPKDLKREFAAHYFSHARIQRRSKRQFNHMISALPEEAAPACEAIRKANLEPDVIEFSKFLQSLDEKSFESQVHYAQQDLLDVAKQSVSSRLPGAPALSHQDRSLARSHIAATRMAVLKSRDEGLYSEATNSAHRQLFKLGTFASGCEIAFVSPEVARQQRMQEGHHDRKALKAERHQEL